jgi:hypothetical protein
VREATLYAFFGNVSADCGRDNNGGRGIRKKMMEQRLSQRSLTLFGGGILPSTNKTKTKRNSSYRSSGIPKSQSNRSKRVKLSSSLPPPKAPLPQETEIIMNHDGTPSSSQKDTDTKQNIIGATPSAVVSKGEELERLNQMWNEYAQQLLRIWAATPPSSTNHINGIELVGARVRILSCPLHRHLEDTEGIVVGQSKHIWTLAVVVDVASKKSPSQTGLIKVRKVPKQNSRVSIAIPIIKPKIKDEDATDEKSSNLYIEIEGPKTR